MLIKRLVIKNFRSYYGEKVFEFQRGLNLILGANGDGKTTFYDALDFVLTDKDHESASVSLSSCVSAKMLANLSVGEVGQVKVVLEMVGNGHHNYILEHSFCVTRNENDDLKIDKHLHCGYTTLGNGTRKQTSVHQLLHGEALFPAMIKKYSLFKGEKALNIFEDKSTLKNLIDLFSDIKDLGPYKEFLSFAEESSNNAVVAAQKKNKQSSQKANSLLREQEELDRKLKAYYTRLDELRSTYSDNNNKINNIESDINTIELVHNMQEAISSLQNDVVRLRSDLNENYSFYLLDNLWILDGFSPILNEFAEKMTNFSNQKVGLESLEKERFLRSKIQKEEEAKSIEKIKDKLSKLPWYIPDVNTMKSMLAQERCLVCGTVAKKGSDAYNHIAEHLKEALDYIAGESKTEAAKEEKYVPVFHLKNIELIHQMSIELFNYGIRIAEISHNIEKLQKHNDAVYTDIQSKLGVIDSKKSEIAKILAQSGSGKDIGDMADNWTNIKHWFQCKEDAGSEIQKLTTKTIPDLKASIKKNTEDYRKCLGTGSAQEFLSINQFFTTFTAALNQAEESTLDEFMQQLAETANRYLDMLNIDDFTGTVHIYKDIRDNSVKVSLVDKTGKIIDNPNTSLDTTMHLSVLFAISELTKDNLDNEYPMILDAPTSSFDEGKDKTFYQVMNERLNKQCIIVTKSYLYKDEATDTFLVDQKSLDRLLAVQRIPVYRIEKKAGFDKKDLSSIETLVTPLY